MSFDVEKFRIFISRIAALAVLSFLFICKSYWESENDIFSSFMYITGIILVGIASLGRMWCSLYIAGFKDEKLITKGPYSICRNPLYFFSMVGVLGVGFCSETITLPVVILLLFSVYYPFVIRSEERRLKSLFGASYTKYARTVPAFFPKFSIFQEPGSYTVNPPVYRVHIFSALWFIWVVGVFKVIEGLRGAGILTPFLIIY
ncbi:MAG: isoprenylcysteine carboxylmethyltransferase family protein [Desulfobacterales bacterium]|nr:isoprenylcysteine carboxylmethyltransferase family protein [Desulfobacterales bacterium]